MQTHTPKQFVLQLGAILALYTSLTALVALLFSTINLAFPDSADYYWTAESDSNTIRTMIAMLIVFFPTYLILTRISNTIRRKEAGGSYTPVTRWLIYLSLLVAGGVMLGDLVTLINYFLNGEITTRFLLKVFTLLIVVGGAFHYYLLDIRDYFKTHIEQSLYFAIGAIVVVLASLSLSFQYTETPSEVREARIDAQQVLDLQEIQSYIESYYYNNTVLPDTIETAYAGLTFPTAPTERAPYRFEVTGEQNYKLCATFAVPTRDSERTYAAIAPEKNYNWQHEAGEWCFERTIVVSIPVFKE